MLSVAARRLDDVQPINFEHQGELPARLFADQLNACFYGEVSSLHPRA